MPICHKKVGVNVKECPEESDFLKVGHFRSSSSFIANISSSDINYKKRGSLYRSETFWRCATAISLD